MATTGGNRIDDDVPSGRCNFGPSTVYSNVWVRALVAPASADPRLDDHQRVARILSGDEDAAAELFHAHRDSVYRVARAITGSHETALDITQDTFLRAFGHLATWRGRASLKTWLTRIAVRLAIDARRRAARSLATSTVDTLSHDPRPEIEQALLLSRIRRLVTNLDGRPGVALRMRLFADLSNREIAEALETSEANVRLQVSRAISRLRKRI